MTLKGAFLGLSSRTTHIPTSMKARGEDVVHPA